MIFTILVREIIELKHSRFDKIKAQHFPEKGQSVCNLRILHNFYINIVLMIISYNF